MDIKDYFLNPMKKYATFSGRASRKEFWMFTAAIIAIYIVSAIIGAILGAISIYLEIIISVLQGIFSLAIMIPTIAIGIRRLHDINKSGWMYLLNIIPFVGGIIVLIFMCLPGTVGPNRFGNDPHGPLADVPLTPEEVLALGGVPSAENYTQQASQDHATQEPSNPPRD